MKRKPVDIFAMEQNGETRPTIIPAEWEGKTQEEIEQMCKEREAEMAMKEDLSPSQKRAQLIERARKLED